jgi:hypothetical protein
MTIRRFCAMVHVEDIGAAFVVAIKTNWRSCVIVWSGRA